MENINNAGAELPEPGCRNRLVRILSLLLALAFVISLPVSLVLLDMGEVLFSPATVAEAITSNVRETGVFQDFLLQHVFTTEQKEAESLKGAFEHLQPAEIQAILEIIIPPSWLESQIQRVVQQLYGWLDNDQIYPRLFLDLQPIRERLLAGGSREIADVVLDSWPSCSMEEINLIRSQITRSGEISLIACEPPEPMRQEMLGLAEEVLGDRIRGLPANLRLFDPRAEGIQPAQAMELKENLRFIRAWSSSSWLLSFALFGMIMALSIRSFQDLASWWGYPLLASGILLFILVLVAAAPFTRSLVRALNAADLPELFRVPIEGIAHNLQEAFVGLALIQFVLLIGLGAGLLLIAFLLRRRARQKS